MLISRIRDAVEYRRRDVSRLTDERSEETAQYMAKTLDEIEKIRQACRICRRILDSLEKIIRPGLATLDLAGAAEEIMRKSGVVSAFKGYRGFPAPICISINNEVVHGIPAPQKTLQEGDIVSLDIGVIQDGYYGDCAGTFPVGRIDPRHQRLIEVSRAALEKAISRARVGNTVGDISSVIQETAESSGFSVVRDYAGHGVGKNLHEEPEIPNFGTAGRGVRLTEHMTLAIEAMVNEGGPWVTLLPDGWTAVTRDGTFSAHFEETVLTSRLGPEILTRLEG